MKSSLDSKSCKRTKKCALQKSIKYYHTEGRYPNATGCGSCKPGFISTENGAAACTACLQGFYASNDRTACIECKAGFQCSAGIKKPCAHGDLWGVTGQANCEACDPGEVPDALGGTCEACKPGFSAAFGVTECKPCDGPGEFSAENASIYCAMALAGHKPSADRTAQVPCESNTFSLGSVNNCTRCAGHKVSEKGAAQSNQIHAKGAYADHQ